MKCLVQEGTLLIALRVMDSPSGQGPEMVPFEAGPSGDKVKFMQGALGGGWSLVSLCSQDASGTTSLCWVRDKADCYLDWVTFSLRSRSPPSSCWASRLPVLGVGGAGTILLLLPMLACSFSFLSSFLSPQEPPQASLLWI